MQHKAGETRRHIYRAQLGNAVALVNGKLAPPELEVKESDIVFIRQVPGAISGGVALFIAGALLIAGASYAGYQIYQQRKQLSQLQEAMDNLGSVSGAVTNLPYLKGANNAKALDHAVPYIIGKNYIAPLHTFIKRRDKVLLDNSNRWV